MSFKPIDHHAQPANDIVQENRLPGDPPTEWDINGWGDPTIQGFGHDISINRGETIFFKIKTDSTDYRIDIYRMGYYGGMGARRVDTVKPSVKLPQHQPEGLRDEATHLYDCGNWESLSFLASTVGCDIGNLFCASGTTGLGPRKPRLVGILGTELAGG